MAQKKKANRAKATSSSDANVTRVRAVDSKPAAKKPAKTKTPKIAQVVDTPAAAEPAAPKSTKKRKLKLPAKAALKPVKATGGYFKGAWVELRQVHWPTRRATWSMTGAVLLYSAFFVVLVLLLDAGFKYLFELILGK